MGEPSARLVWRAVTAAADAWVGTSHVGYRAGRVSRYEGRIGDEGPPVATVVAPWATDPYSPLSEHKWAVAAADPDAPESRGGFLGWGTSRTLADATAAAEACLAAGNGKD